MIEQDTYSEEELQEGRYGFLSGDTFELGNLVLLHPEKSSDIAYQSYLVPANNNAVGIRRTIRRLPATDGKAYGNNILKVKVEVFYTRKIEYKNLTPDDIESITIESIKISN